MTRLSELGRGPLAAGLDIGGSKILAVALDGRRDLRAQVRRPTEHGGTGVVESAAAALRDLAHAAGVDVGDFSVIGVGVPGVVESGTGHVSHAVNLGLSDGLALGAALRDRIGVPVVVENDVNAAALGAARVLDLDDTDLALLNIGTGLGAGLVTGGRLRRGARGAAGEIGHVPVDPSGPACGCGQRGCLEMLASGAALSRAWPVEGAGPAASALFAAAAHGDARAVAVRDTFADHVASAVRLLVLTCDVETVVLGGGVSELGPPLLDAVTGALHRQAGTSVFLKSLDLPARVALVPAGSPVGAVGAALAGVLEHASEEPGRLDDGDADRRLA